MTDIELPYNWRARPHQKPLMQYMTSRLPGRRAVAVWHRRAGKDSCSLNFTAAEAHNKIAVYWHMLPTANQARKVVWDNIDPHTGVRVIDQVFPKELRKSINNTDMKIELKCGSIWQCVGSDNYDSLVGTAPFGVVFSEYSVADPAAWDFIRPILRENGGWAIFIYTPRGKNHGHDLLEMAQKNENWFCEVLNIDNTYRDNARTVPVFSKEDYEEELNSGMDPLTAMQEYYCSFDAGLKGSYFLDQLRRVEDEGRYGDWPWKEDTPVQTYWDLGYNDDNFIIFAQPDGEFVRIVDCVKGSSRSLRDWIKYVSEQPYVYNRHCGPHDLEQHDYTIGITRREFARKLGFNFEVVAKSSQVEGIDSSRRMLSKVRIDSKCKELWDSLMNYRREWDPKREIFREKPLHDWSSHGAKAFQYLAQGWQTRGGTLEHMIHRNTRPKVIRAVGGKRQNANNRNNYPF